MSRRKNLLSQKQLEDECWDCFLIIFLFDLGMDVSIWKEQFPISTVALFYRKQDALTHRDILGSLMGLNIKRELIGEILTAEDFAVIFCTQTAQQIILSELERVGKAGIKKEQGYTGPLPKAYRLEYQSGTVSSFRLDCIVSLAINASREKSAGLIESGLVNLNFFEETKNLPGSKRRRYSFYPWLWAICFNTGRFLKQEGKNSPDHREICLEKYRGKPSIR